MLSRNVVRVDYLFQGVELGRRVGLVAGGDGKHTVRVPSTLRTLFTVMSNGSASPGHPTSRDSICPEGARRLAPVLIARPPFFLAAYTARLTLRRSYSALAIMSCMVFGSVTP